MNEVCNVWIIDDDNSIRWVLEKAFSKSGMETTSFDNAEDALSRLRKEVPDVIVSDIRMPGMDGLELLERVHQRSPELPVIIMTAHSDLDSAVSAYHGGAFEYLPKPFDISEAVDKVERACQQHHEAESEMSSEADELPEIIGEAWLVVPDPNDELLVHVTAFSWLTVSPTAGAGPVLTVELTTGGADFNIRTRCDEQRVSKGVHRQAALGGGRYAVVRYDRIGDSSHDDFSHLGTFCEPFKAHSVQIGVGIRVEAVTKEIIVEVRDVTLDL